MIWFFRSLAFAPVKVLVRPIDGIRTVADVSEEFLVMRMALLIPERGGDVPVVQRRELVSVRDEVLHQVR